MIYNSRLKRQKMEKIIVWLIKGLLKFQNSFVLVREGSRGEEFFLTIIQSIPLSDPGEIRVLGWEIAKGGNCRYSVKRIYNDIQQEVKEGTPFVTPGVPSIFIIFDGFLFECKITKRK